MITGLKFKNYKCLNDVSFQFSKLNIFSGYNGRGKSSVMQYLLMLSQSTREPQNLNYLHPNGHFVELGNFEDLLTIKSKDLWTEITVASDPQKEFVLQLSYKQKSDDEKLGYIASCVLNGEEQIVRIDDIQTNDQQNISITKDVRKGNNKKFNNESNTPYLSLPQYVKKIFEYKKYHYVSADRIGPIKYAEKYEIPKVQKVMPSGEDVYNIIANYKENIPKNRCYNGKRAQKLLTAVSGWLAYILRNGQLQIRQGTPKEPILTPRIKMSKNQKNAYTLCNVGYGYSYIEAVIVSALIAKSGDCLFIENPEAHLHPEAQARITEVLALAAADGVQVFVETHSEHIVNNFRIAVLRDDIALNNDDVSLYFMGLDKIHRLEVKADGKINNWPSGFFDQYQNELTTLYRLSARKNNK